MTESVVGRCVKTTPELGGCVEGQSAVGTQCLLDQTMH